MFCTIINDCRDDDAVGRQGTRVASLLDVSPTFVGVRHELDLANSFTDAELEAAGCLIDVLDAAEGREGVVLVNVAHRHAKGKRWENGTPFCYFWYGKTVIVSSVDGVVLSLVKKLGITERVWLMDVPTVMLELERQGIVSSEVAAHVCKTQFRSFDFTPRVGALLVHGGEVPAEEYSLAEIEDVTGRVWFVDNFGNCKTTLLAEDVRFAAGEKVQTKFGEVRCYERLKDVPNGEAALIVGSSGIENKRFLEIVVQGSNAAEKFGLSVGSEIL